MPRVTVLFLFVTLVAYVNSATNKDIANDFAKNVQISVPSKPVQTPAEIFDARIKSFMAGYRGDKANRAVNPKNKDDYRIVRVGFGSGNTEYGGSDPSVPFEQVYQKRVRSATTGNVVWKTVAAEGIITPLTGRSVTKAQEAGVVEASFPVGHKEKMQDLDAISTHNGKPWDTKAHGVANMFNSYSDIDFNMMPHGPNINEGSSGFNANEKAIKSFVDLGTYKQGSKTVNNGRHVTFKLVQKFKQADGTKNSRAENVHYDTKFFDGDGTELKLASKFTKHASASLVNSKPPGHVQKTY